MCIAELGNPSQNDSSSTSSFILYVKLVNYLVIKCYQTIWNEINQEKSMTKDNRRRLNGSVFCNMSLGEELTITFNNMTKVSYVGRHPQP